MKIPKITLNRLLEYRCIVFDFDGTLCDTILDIRKSFETAASICGLEPERLKPIPVGPPLGASLRAAVDGEIDDSLLERLKSEYRRAYDASDFSESPLFPGALELLTELRNCGKQIALATNKGEESTLRILNIKGITPLFDHVFCCDHGGEFWSKERMIRTILELSQCKADEGIFFGDARGDMVAGRNVGVATVAALYGYGESSELLETGPDFVCERLGQLIGG